MRIDSPISPWTELNRAWNLIDRYWPAREYELVAATFPIDMYQQDGRIFVRASMPGVKPEDLNVNLEQNVLTISGESRDMFEEGGGGRVFHREHAFGKFLRSIRLPEHIDESEIDAQLDNGVLTICIPLKKDPVAQPQRIAVRTVVAEPKAVETHGAADSPKEPVGHPKPKRQPVRG